MRNMVEWLVPVPLLGTICEELPHEHQDMLPVIYPTSSPGVNPGVMLGTPELEVESGVVDNENIPEDDDEDVNISEAQPDPPMFAGGVVEAHQDKPMFAGGNF